MDEVRAAFLIILATAFIGVFWVVRNFLVKELTPEVINFWWFLSALVMLFIINVIFFRKELFVPKNKKQLILVGFFNLLGSLSALYGIQAFGAAGTAFLVQFTLIFSVVLGFVFLNEKVSKSKSVGIILVLIGATVMSLDKQLVLSGGLAFGLIAALFYSLAYLFAKKATVKSNPITINFFRVLVMVFFALIIMALSSPTIIIPTVNQSVLIIFGSACSAVIGTSLFYKGLKHIKLAYANSLKLSETLFALIYSVILFIDIPSGIVIFGGIILLIGNAIIALNR